MRSRQTHLSLLGHTLPNADREDLTQAIDALGEALNRARLHNHLLKKGLINQEIDDTYIPPSPGM